MTHVQRRYAGEDPRERERERERDEAAQRHRGESGSWEFIKKKKKKKTSPGKYLSGGAASTIHSLSAVM